MVVIVLAAAATWLLPAGRYDTLSYDADRKAFIRTTPQGEQQLPATAETLQQLGVQISLEQFTNGSIRKPVSIPKTYHTVDPKPQGITAIFTAPVLGIQQAIDVILFVLIIGGFIAVFRRTGAFESGIQALATKLRGREAWLIIVVCVLMALGGTTFGMAEETIAFYPLLVPVFLAAGYDALVPLAVIFLGSHVGFMASTTNPFSVIIASDAAGVSWTTGLYGRIAMLAVAVGVTIAYILRYARRTKSGKQVDTTAVGADVKARPLTGRMKLLLGVFAATFVVMIIGVSRLGWWFTEMAALFFVMAIIGGAIERLDELDFVHTFLDGAKELLGVAFIIGFARGATVVLDRGEVSSSIVYYASALVERTPGVSFIVALLFVYVVLTLFIASSSGMAVLTMPIMGTLAGFAGVPREEIVNAYMYGMGIMGLITPVGLILPSLAMVNVSYRDWLRFVLPLIGLLTLISILFLAIGVSV